MKLDEIREAWEGIDVMLTLSDGEITPEIQAQIDALELNEAEKLDAYAWVIKSLRGDAEFLKAREDELAQKRRAKVRAQIALETRAELYMRDRGVTELKGRLYKFKMVASGRPAVQVLVPPGELPREWKTVTVTANKDAIREALLRPGGCFPERHGWPVAASELARLGEVTPTLRIY